MKYFLKKINGPLCIMRATQWGRVARIPFFCNLSLLFFCSHFEELQTVLIKVKLIFNNAPLTCVYPNTINTYLTLRPRMPHICGFPDCFSFSHFLATSCRF